MGVYDGAFKSQNIFVCPKEACVDANAYANSAGAISSRLAFGK